jgi:hypothetical protein
MQTPACCWRQDHAGGLECGTAGPDAGDWEPVA